ncbi:MAG: hypothetical protein GXP25_02830 [Planctomycetes bacterium]|nr:hypothetical protein [Planctomycetota bacterium]
MKGEDSVFRKFLDNSYDRGRELERESDILRIEARRGEPPTGFLCSFVGVEHLVRDPDGTVEKCTDPILIEVQFPPDYLKSCDPHLGLRVVGMLNRNIFHPNIRPPAVCLGNALRPGTTLDEILRYVYEIISYQNVTPNESDAFSAEACRYVREHPGVLSGLRIPPLRRRKLRNVTTTVRSL